MSFWMVDIGRIYSNKVQATPLHVESGSMEKVYVAWVLGLTSKLGDSGESQLGNYLPAVLPDAVVPIRFLAEHSL